MLNSVAGEGVPVAGIKKTDEKIPETDKDSGTETDTDVDICGIDEEQPDDEVSPTPMDAEETESDVEEPAAGKQKDSKTPARKRKKQLIGEDVCFICFDGGELFLCDRQGCNKGYHPSCVNRDEAFFRAKGVWTCGWHICSICEKTAYYKCYTCPFSLCRGCVKDGVILCVRRNKGFCESCIEVVKLIENIDQGDKKVEVDFDDTSSWEFLFKDYWVELKETLSISHDEIALAKNPYIEKTASQQHDVDNFASSSDSDNRLTRLSRKRKSKKPLNSHFPIEAETEANEDIHKEKKRKFRKKSDVRGPQSDRNGYAAIDSHNINLIYLRRKLMEDLLEDSDRFHDTVVGTFVRIRISASNQKQDVYRLVQVVGTMKVDEPYRVEKRKSDILLEILNLHKTEITPINSISNQPFTEDECDRLRQSIKCGLIKRPTVGEILDKALALQHTLVTDWLETEIVRLSHLRDRASEKGRKKELRECVEKLQILKTPAERLRRLEQIPEIHADPNMHPNYKSVDDGDETDTDDNRKEGNNRFVGKERNPVIARKSESFQKDFCSRPRKSSVTNSEPKQPRSDIKSEPSIRMSSKSQPQSRIIKKSTSQPAVKSEPRKYSDANSEPKQPTSDIKSEPSTGILSESQPQSSIIKKSTSQPAVKSEPRKYSYANSEPKQPTSDIKSEPSTRIFSESHPQSSIIQKSTSQPAMKSEPRKHSDANSESKQPISDVKSEPSTGISSESQLQSCITEKSSQPAGKSEPAVKPEKIWHYEDPSKKIQGPFSMAQLRRWSDKSSFPASLRIWKKCEAQSESILLTDALAGKFEKNNSAVPSKAEVSDLVEKNKLLKKQACGSPKPPLAETPPPRLPENVNAGVFSRGVEGSVEYEDRDRFSSPGNKAGNSRLGFRKVCPYNQNGECKLGACCSYLHN